MVKRVVNTGWNQEAENYAALDRLQSDDFLRAMRGHYQEVKLDPRKLIKVENQGSQGSCFPAGTPVTLSDGRLIPIEDVLVGHEVITHRSRARNVVNVMHRLFSGDMVTVAAVGQDPVTATEDHLFYVWRDGLEQWVSADKLVDTDLVIIQGLPESDEFENREAGQLRPIRTLSRESVENLQVFDFEVAEDHSFCAAGYVVHNCAGHSLSSVVEWCYSIATAGKSIELSRAMAYYEAQRISGIRGDKGSTIEAGEKLVTGTGLALESLWMYPRSYSPERPADYPAVLKSAKDHLIKTSVRIQSYEAWRVFIGSGQGGIHTGINWGDEMDRAVVESFSGAGGGGHSICGLCLSERVDAQGRPYSWIKNSWGHQFGSKVYPGWHEWSPAAVESMLRHRWTVFVGMSDLDKPEPRKYSLEDWKKGIKLYGETNVAP